MKRACFRNAASLKTFAPFPLFKSSDISEFYPTTDRTTATAPPPPALRTVLAVRNEWGMGLSIHGSKERAREGRILALYLERAR